MSEEQVRQAIREDFPAAAAKLTSAVHPSEKTTVLSLSIADLLLHTAAHPDGFKIGKGQFLILWPEPPNANRKQFKKNLTLACACVRPAGYFSLWGGV
jgi:hypothetical protein